jgi:hypothetical protein
MDGLRFVRGDHLSIGSGVYLPSAAIPDLIWKFLTEQTPKHLRAYTPDLLKSDFFYLYDKDLSLFGIFISTVASGPLPTWGSDMDFFAPHVAQGISFIGNDQDCIDISGLRLANETFAAFDFKPGPALIGRWPEGYEPEVKAEQLRLAKAAAEVIWAWAERERTALEISRIFLSHKGVDKPLIEKIDSTLGLLGLKPWLDKHDLPVGSPLVRSVDDAFSNCCAAVFFISASYVDQGVIAGEIDRAIHESALRPDGFKIIPLVLKQHGGSDTNVPQPLQKLKWESVDDIDILPTILKALPTNIRETIKYKDGRS